MLHCVELFVCFVCILCFILFYYFRLFHVILVLSSLWCIKLENLNIIFLFYCNGRFGFVALGSVKLKL